MKNCSFVMGGISLAVLASLAACGGGDSGSSSSASSLTISGTAATGLAISGATVNYVCASGTGTGTTNSAGSYQLTVTSGALPCVGQVTIGSDVHHTLIAASTTSTTTATANITPMTELVVASVAGTDTSTFYDSFKSMSTSGKAAAVTATKVATAQLDVKATLSDGGITTLSGTDLLTGTLVPGSSTDTYDVALETLKTNLNTSGSNLATLSTTVAASSSASSSTDSTSTSSTETTSLPASLLLKAPASTCAALRSTTYRVVQAYAAEKITVDAVGLTITNSSGQVFNLTPVSGDSCHFTVLSTTGISSTQTGDLVISPAGFGVMRFYNSTTSAFSLAVLFPEQTGLNTLANAAGTWNTLSMEATSTSGTFAGHLIQSEWDSNGAALSTNYCGKSDDWDNTSCLALSGTEAASAAGTASVNTDDNGYYITAQGQITPGRRFVYKTGSGHVVVATTWADGSVEIATKQRSLSAPVAGDSNNYWNLAETKALAAQALTAGTTTVVSVTDATSATTNFVRTNVTTGSSPTDLHSETIANNTPYNGFRLRAAGTDTSVTPNQSYSRLVQLPLKGVGVTVALNETNKRYQFSVTKPD